MVYYQDADSLTRLSDPMFDMTYGPGDAVPFAGIYKCAGCEREIVASDTFPSGDQHPHLQREGELRWKLIVRAR